MVGRRRRAAATLAAARFASLASEWSASAFGTGTQAWETLLADGPPPRAQQALTRSEKRWSEVDNPKHDVDFDDRQSAFTASVDDSVGRQLLQVECPELASGSSKAASTWAHAEVLLLDALGSIHRALAVTPALSRGSTAPPPAALAAFAVFARALAELLANPSVALHCPVACAQHLRRAAEWAAAFGQLRRARVLLQLGNAFKLEGLWRWLAASRTNPEFARANPRFHSRLHAEYILALDQLQTALEVPQQPLLIWPSKRIPQIEVHSLCAYRKSASTGAQSRRSEEALLQPLGGGDGRRPSLPELSVPNHRAYTEKHGLRYVLHTELPRPDLEPQYNKMTVVRSAFESPTAPDWILFIDCDAFFTNVEVKIVDLLATYAAPASNDDNSRASAGPHFLVAEDPGGINTGVFLARNVPWTIEFLTRVEANAFRVAWDQSMFFWEMLWPSVLEERSVLQGDFKLPSEVALVHQAHLNAYVPPASRDWRAHEWQPGDFICHFAGCPQHEQECLDKMVQMSQIARAS